MVLTERSERKPLGPDYFNVDGSYTQHGVLMEISKHIIRVPNHEHSLNLMAEQKRMRIVPRFPEMPLGIAFLSRPEIKTYEEPARHNNNSGAEYVVDWYRYKADDGRENIIWFSRIPPKKGTSKPPHTHGLNPNNGRGAFEHYLRVSGVTYMGEGEGGREMAEYEIVPPNTQHYIETGEEGAVFFILLENVEGIADEDIHQHARLA